MLRTLFDREGVAVGMLAMFNLSLDKVASFFVGMSSFFHVILDVSQAVVALATAAYFIVKTIRGWHKWRHEKAADDHAGPRTDRVRDTDSEEG